MVMQEELNHFTRNDGWRLVLKQHNDPIVGGKKQVIKNKLNIQDNVIRNKERLVTKGYNQSEGIDFDETYTPVAILEDIQFSCIFM